MNFFADKDESLSQAAPIRPVADDCELSELNDTWRNLLGVNDGALAGDTEQAPENGTRSPVPVVADPWGELLHSQGIELVDLQQCRPHRPQTIQVSFSEQEVEQALQFLQEQ